MNEDLSLIEDWLHKEHIKKWYEIPGLCTMDDWLSEIKGRHDEFRFIAHFIALWDERPIGFCQYYQCKDADNKASCNALLSNGFIFDEKNSIFMMAK